MKEILRKMSKYKFAAIILSALLVTGPVVGQQLDTSNCAVVPYASLPDWTRIRMWADDHHLSLKPADLDKQEIATVFRFCRESVAGYNKRMDTTSRYKQSMKDRKFNPYKYKVDTSLLYFVQMIPVMQPNGDKMVFVICVCMRDWLPKDDLRKNTLEGIDFGTCHFQFKVNLATGKVFDMWVDGEG